MKATFLNEDPQTVFRVYSPETVAEIAKITELETNVCTAAQLLSGERDLSETELLFSTWGMPALSEAEIKNFLPKLKAVFYAAGTVQKFAKPFLSRGVQVFSAWAANAVPVAEFTEAQIVLAGKGYFSSSNAASPEDYREKKKTAAAFPGNFDTKIGIIGAGMVGKLVIERLKSHRMEILVFDPFLPDETAAALGVRKTDLMELFSSCTVVSNHLANNAQTKGMLNKSLFNAMPENATFLNTGRGAQVVESDLIEVLKSRPDLTALLDVTYPEPPEEKSALYHLKNCRITPHIAGSSGKEVHRMAEYMTEECALFCSGKATRYGVTEKMLETMA